jgi:hypothetical protein
MMVATTAFLRHSPDSSINAAIGLVALVIWLFILWGLAKLWLRRRDEKRWPKAVGLITSKQVSVIENERGYTSRYRADFRYEITVNANSWSGEFHSRSTIEDTCNANAKTIEIGQSIVVRDNPSNAGESAILAKDNPDIPFKLDWK